MKFVIFESMAWSIYNCQLNFFFFKFFFKILILELGLVGFGLWCSGN